MNRQACDKQSRDFAGRMSEIMLLRWPLKLLGGVWKLRLLGPLFRFEIVRASRQGRFFSLRCLYVGTVLLLLYLVYASWFGWDGSAKRVRLGESDPGGPAFIEPGLGEMAAFANAMAMAFLWAQFVAVLLLTPILTAGAITEERGRRTLDFLLVTHLHDSEIVVGKLVARLGHMVLILASGLPLLALVELLGGVDPNFVLAAFICTVAFLLGLGSFAIFASASAPNTRHAVARTYYLGVCYCLGTLFCLPFGNWLDWAADGNPAAFLTRELGDMRPAAVPRGLPVAVSRFLAFHAVAAVLFCSLAVRRLRRPLDQLSPRRLRLLHAERGTSKAAAAQAVHESRHRPMPRDNDNLLWWKECTFEMAPPLRHRDVCLVALIVCLVSCVSLGPLISFSLEQSRSYAAESRNIWVRSWGTFLFMLLLIAIAFDAASRFSRERSRRTLDSLLATPLENRTILAAKIVGSIAVLRGFCIFLGIFWSFGLMTLSMSLLAFPLVIGGGAVYAILVALIGVSFSMVCRNTMRATLYTLIAFAGLCITPLFLGLAVESLARSADWSEAQTHWVTLPLYSLSPPVTLWFLPFPDSALGTPELDGSPAHAAVAGSALGLAFAAGLAWFLWDRLNARFGKITGRMPIPEAGSASSP